MNTLQVSHISSGFSFSIDSVWFVQQLSTHRWWKEMKSRGQNLSQMATYKNLERLISLWTFFTRRHSYFSNWVSYLQKWGNVSRTLQTKLVPKNTSSKFAKGFSIINHIITRFVNSGRSKQATRTIDKIWCSFELMVCTKNFRPQNMQESGYRQGLKGVTQTPVKQRPANYN